MYNVVVVPTIVYGCEVWVWKERDKSRVQEMEMKVLKGVARVTRLDCVRNEEIRTEVGSSGGIGEEKERKMERQSVGEPGQYS